MLPFSTPKAILIPTALIEQMRAEVVKHPDEEVCGLLAGSFDGERYQVKLVIPTTNILHSPARYLMEPREQLEAFTQIEAQGLELIGIYHSHLSLPTGPSDTDIREAYYPEVVYLIWSHPGGSLECRGFSIQDSVVSKVKIIKIDDQQRFESKSVI